MTISVAVYKGYQHTFPIRSEFPPFIDQQEDMQQTTAYLQLAYCHRQVAMGACSSSTQTLRVGSFTEEVLECHSCIDKPLQRLSHAVHECCEASKEYYK